MFSNLGQNSILYVFDIQGDKKILSGPIERVTLPRPKYSNFNPSFDMVVDIYATINGEKREFKGVPNNSIADFGNDTYIIAESKDALISYINSLIQNSDSVINSVDRHTKLKSFYEEALQELNPAIKADKEKDKIIKSLQSQVDSLQKGMDKILSIMTKEENK